MEDKNKATEKDAQNIATEEKVAVSTEDAGAKIAALEAEKAKLIEESANYRMAYLKEHKKNEGADSVETEDEKIRRIAKETLAETRIFEIEKEKDALLQKTLKENKELKLAHLNKNTVVETTTTHTEGQGVKDTLITPDQLAAFKARGWTDKDIERYKRNLQRYKA